MGIIDDYYGGYGNLALYTSQDGDVDFDAAYGTSCPWDAEQSDSEAASARSQNRLSVAKSAKVPLSLTATSLPRARKIQSGKRRC